MKCLSKTAAMSALALAGCAGGSGAGDPTYGPAGLFVGNGPPVSVTYDDETLTISDGTDDVTLERAPDVAQLARFRGYFATNQATGVVATTQSGEGAVWVMWWGEKGLVGTHHARLGDTQLPTGGSASYSGEYAAVLTTSENTLFGPVLRGDVTLDANFADNTISGLITERRAVSSIVNLEDTELRPGTIGNGAFSGETSGGRALDAPFIVSVGDGTYEGLFTGPDGEEAVGSVVIPHVFSGQAVTERGAFVAD